MNSALVHIEPWFCLNVRWRPVDFVSPSGKHRVPAKEPGALAHDLPGVGTFSQQVHGLGEVVVQRHGPLVVLLAEEGGPHAWEDRERTEFSDPRT
ncbi:hypothetical protein ACFWBB_08110 [Streptomyces sp. NPDC060000]|uniref:hypothetical protein n=1 Tax=Streptomyces sp. NPDC060000 TaxID=3347031 RepID=UPI0036920BBA